MRKLLKIEIFENSEKNVEKIRGNTPNASGRAFTRKQNRLRVVSSANFPLNHYKSEHCSTIDPSFLSLSLKPKVQSMQSLRNPGRNHCKDSFPLPVLQFSLLPRAPRLDFILHFVFFHFLGKNSHFSR